MRNLPEEEFTLRLDGDSVEITSGRFKSRMAVADPSEYPTIPDVPPDGEYSLPLDLFQLMLDRVAFSITKDDPEVSTQRCAGETPARGNRDRRDRRSSPVGGSRQRTRRSSHHSSSSSFRAKLLAEFARFGDENVELSASDNHLGFRMGERTLVSRIVELRFPQYERVIVRDNPSRARVDRKEFLGLPAPGELDGPREGTRGSFSL